MRGSYIFFGLLACAVTTASGTTLPQDGHSGVRVPQLEARSLEQQTIKDGSAWSSGTRLAKRSSTARLGKRSDSTQRMLSNMRRYEQQLWAEFYDCVQYKVS